MSNVQTGPVKAPTALPVRPDAAVAVLEEGGAVPASEEAEETHTFYSKIPALCISVGKGKRVVVDGEYTRIDEKIVEFQPQADHYGVYQTRDPRIIEYLEQRAKTVRDVMLPGDYNDAILRPEDKIRQLKAANQRQIEENNRLLAMLNEKTAPK